MRYWFIKMLLWWMYRDIQITKNCIENAKAMLAHDQRRYHELELELLEMQK